MAIATVTDADRARIRDAIAAAEATTSGEIFVVVARESDEYLAVPILWASVAALLTPLPLILFTLIPAATIYLIQLAVFAVVATVLVIPPVRIAIVPGRLKELRAHRLAVDQFLAHGLQMTEARTGVLVFVSLMERYAEVVADAGIAAKVEHSAWNGIVSGMIAELRAGKLAEGLEIAVRQSGALLAQHFPPRPLDRNEIPNELIIL